MAHIFELVNQLFAQVVPVADFLWDFPTRKHSDPGAAVHCISASSWRKFVFYFTVWFCAGKRI